MDEILVWHDPEQVKEGMQPTIYVSLEGMRGDILLKKGGWKLSLFLSQTEADNLALAINCNLQQIALLKKEITNEGNTN